MPFLQHGRLKRKLTLITMLSSGLALLLACLAIAAFEQFRARALMVEDLWGEAGMFGDSSSAALTFNDPTSASQTLRSLSADTHIVGAAIYDRDGVIFATYQRNSDESAFVAPAVQVDGHHFSATYFDLFRQFSVAGEAAGTIFLRSDLGELDQRTRDFFAIVALVLIIAVLFAYLLSNSLLGVFSKPMAELATVVRRISQQRDYSVRASKHSDDELGQLTDGINEMLDQIQSRDSALEEARNGLERRVETRTEELRREIAERLQVETALRDSEERFSSAFELAAIGMALAAPDGRWLKVNRALCELLGFSAAELLLGTFQGMTHVDDLPHDLELLGRLLRHEVSSGQLEKRYLHKLGHPVWVLLNVSMVCDPSGAPIYFIAQIQDISQRKHAELELERTHLHMIEMSRKSGMAEVASNVLHNVGNVLNSVNVSASLVVESVRDSRADSLLRIVELLREQQADLAGFLSVDGRSKHVLDFLEQLAQAWQAQKQIVSRELLSLCANIDHIKAIVSMQQNFAKVSGALELVRASDLVEDSVRMNEAGLMQTGITVIREFADVPAFSVEKHKVLQILVNLVRNAKHACDERAGTDKRITLGIEQIDRRICISVRDNGVGIAAENLTRIFAHGFTTRKDGHGFGLHSGALAAAELGGSLRAHSNGAGQGATLILELPQDPPGASP